MGTLSLVSEYLKDLEECIDDGDSRVAREAKLFDALEHKSVVIELDLADSANYVTKKVLENMGFVHVSLRDYSRKMVNDVIMKIHGVMFKADFAVLDYVNKEEPSILFGMDFLATTKSQKKLEAQAKKLSRWGKQTTTKAMTLTNLLPLPEARRNSTNFHHSTTTNIPSPNHKAKGETERGNERLNKKEFSEEDKVGIIEHGLPKKMCDPRNYVLLVKINGIVEMIALVDTGASVIRHTYFPKPRSKSYVEAFEMEGEDDWLGSFEVGRDKDRNVKCNSVAPSFIDIEYDMERALAMEAYFNPFKNIGAMKDMGHTRKLMVMKIGMLEYLKDLEECIDDGDSRVAREAKLFDALEHKSVVIELDLADSANYVTKKVLENMGFVHVSLRDYSRKMVNDVIMKIHGVMFKADFAVLDYVNKEEPSILFGMDFLATTKSQKKLEAQAKKLSRWGKQTTTKAMTLTNLLPLPEARRNSTNFHHSTTTNIPSPNHKAKGETERGNERLNKKEFSEEDKVGIIEHGLPKKMCDPRNYVLLVKINGIVEMIALVDTGASVIRHTYFPKPRSKSYVEAFEMEGEDDWLGSFEVGRDKDRNVKCNSVAPSFIDIEYDMERALAMEAYFNPFKNDMGHTRKLMVMKIGMLGLKLLRLVKGSLIEHLRPRPLQGSYGLGGDDYVVSAMLDFGGSSLRYAVGDSSREAGFNDDDDMDE
uniref:Reverse transcriptase domain-containing protein n=1 Tax=Tanacetum cinerariifolium TaxID=118510 RepID=A0A6L2N726_TANCI|nr:hypothetical protein [Tanacetum cinerariifolium]